MSANVGSLELLLLRAAAEDRVEVRLSRGNDAGKPEGWETYLVDGKPADDTVTNAIVGLFDDGLLDPGSGQKVTPTGKGLTLIEATA